MADAVIRVGSADDAHALDLLCRATALSGDPQPDDVVDPGLVSLVYALPYLALEPQASRVLEKDAQVVGYVVGALDSPRFYRRWASDWAPRHLPRPAGADAALVSLLADPAQALPAGIERFPSHLHVNLATEARGGGWGARLLESFLEGLRAAGSPGVHLRVGAENTPAIRFYRRLGFAVLGGDDTLVMVRQAYELGAAPK